MDFYTLLAQIINGLQTGSVYALVALGYSMVYGIIMLLNFAHGDIIMVGAYVVYYSIASFAFPPIVAVTLAVIMCTILGVAIEKVAYTPLRSAPRLSLLITAIGVSFLLENGAQLVFGADQKSMTTMVNGSLTLGPVGISYAAIVTIVVSVIAMAGDEVQMYLTSLLMVHNPATMAAGDHNEMERAIAMLAEVKESIINAYAAKTGLARAKISHLMESESYLNANKAVELGFADTILTREGDSEESVLANAVLFSPREVSNVIFNKLTKVCTATDDVKTQQVENKAKDTLQTEPPKDKGADSGTDATNNSEDGGQKQPASDSRSNISQGRSVDELMERLSIIKNHI